MAMPDMDVIEAMPGYRVILKAVLKSQIKQLIEQLASATNEESIILMASVADGTLSHLGSDSAKGFLEDHEDLKSKFLCQCMSMYQKQQEEEKRGKEQKDQEEAMLKLQQAAAGQYGQVVHSYSSQFVSPRKSGLVHPVSLTRSSPGKRHEPYSRPSSGRVTPNKMTQVTSVKTEPNDESGSEIVTFKNNNHQSSYQSYSAVANDDENVNCEISVEAENFSDESRVVCGDGDKSEVSDDVSVNVKQEATSDSEMDLEITGVEVGQPMQPQDWSVNVSLAMNFDPTGATGSQADMTGESSNKIYKPIQLRHSKSYLNMMTNKRKCNDLSLADKYEVIKLLDQKMQQTQIAKKMGCHQSQVSRISSNRANIMEEYMSNTNQVLEEKACALANTLDKPEFKPSTGWLHFVSRWKQQNNIDLPAAEKEDSVPILWSDVSVPVQTRVPREDAHRGETLSVRPL